MNMVSRMLIEPGLNIRVLMRCIVVHDEVDIEIFGHLLIDVIEKIDELFITMARQAFSDHVAVQNVKRGKKGCRTIAPVVVALAFGNASLQRQNRRSSLQCLNLRLLVDTKHQSFARRLEVKPHDIADFFDEVRVIRELEMFDTLGLQSMVMQNPVNARRAHPKSGCQ